MKKTAISSRLWISVAVLVVANIVAPAWATTIYWDSSGTSWNTAASWSTNSAATTPDPAAVPGSADDLVFHITGVTADQSIGLTVDQAAKSFTFISPGKTTFTASSKKLVVGSGGVTVNSGVGAVTFGTSSTTVAMRLGESQTWINNSSATVNCRNHINGWESATAPITWTVNCAGSGDISDSGLLNDGNTSVSVVVASIGSGAVFTAGGNYSGGTTIKSGIYSSASPGTGNLLIGDTEGSRDATYKMNNTGTITNSITVQAGSSGNTLTITGGSGSPTTQILGGTLALNNNLTVTPIASIAMTFSNVVSGAGSLTKNGTTLILSGPNTFTGKTRINAGTLSVGSLNRVSGGTASSNLGAPVTVDNGTISIGTVGTAATLSYTGAGETTDRVIDLAGTTGGATINQSGTGLLKFTGNLTATGEGAKTLTLQGSTDGAGEVAGNIPNNTVANLTRVTKAGTGLWTLSGANSFSGATAIQNGILRVSSLNRVTGGTASSSLGAPALANATISLGYNSTTGQLTYAGSGETTDRVINLAGTTGGGTLEAAGTGPLVFTSAFTATGTGSKTLTLQGSSTATNTIAASIVNKDANNRTRLTKDGSGLWLLNGTTTYSGPTTVANGTLAINGRILSPVTVQNGGVLTGAGTILTNNVTALTVGGILDPGRVGGIGALSVTGSVVFAEGRFHVDATGASADRLNVSGSVASSGGTVPVRATITNPGLTKSWKILSASGGITAEFASAGIGYTVAKANADTELWLLKNPEGTVMLVR